MSVILNDIKIWRSLLQDIPDLYEDSDILKVRFTPKILMRRLRFLIYLFTAGSILFVCLLG